MQLGSLIIGVSATIKNVSIDPESPNFINICISENEAKDTVITIPLHLAFTFSDLFTKMREQQHRMYQALGTQSPDPIIFPFEPEPKPEEDGPIGPPQSFPLDQAPPV